MPAINNSHYRELLTLFCLGLFFFVGVPEAFGQWRVFSIKERKNNIETLIRENMEFSDNYTFFSTSYIFNEDVLTKGYAPFQNDSTWIKGLSNFEDMTSRVFYFNLYTKNVAQFKIYFFENEHFYYEKIIRFTKDGYQVPFEFFTNIETKRQGLISELFKLNDSISYPIFVATVEPRSSKSDIEFSVGEAISYKRSFNKTPSKGNWFHYLTNNEENRFDNYIESEIGNNYPLIQYADFVPFGSSSFVIESDEVLDDKYLLQSRLLYLIKEFFLKYSYYRETQIDRDSFIREIDSIIFSEVYFEDKLNLLNNKAQALHDGHFYFEFSKRVRSSRSIPLILKRIGKYVEVVGVRDASLGHQIQIGDKLLSVNGLDVVTILDSLNYKYFGDLEQRQEMAIAHLLENDVGQERDSVILKNKEDSIYKVAINYDAIYPPPVRFVPEHFGFKRLLHNWRYLKLNRWDKGDWIRFYNLRDSLQDADGIIFDLRGNPGGFEMETMMIGTSFLDGDFIYSTQTYQQNGQEELSGHTILQPNQYLDLSALKIIVLVDSRTACASEAFALMLKRIKDAIIIGTSKTAGAFSTVYSFQLPDGIRLFANVLSKRYMFDDKITLERIGIVPDTIVPIREYNDLFGYEDKVLAEACDLIDRSIGYIN